MAKKTTKKPAKKKVPPTPTATAAAPTAKAPKPAPAKKAATPKPPAVTDDEIGYAAGDVWGALHGKGWQTLAAIKKEVDQPADVTLMAIGWLAREGKLDFAASGRSVKVTLK